MSHSITIAPEPSRDSRLSTPGPVRTQSGQETILTIEGSGIRANIHVGPQDPLAPVIGLLHAGVVCQGLGAYIHGPADVIYATTPEHRRLCGADVFIKTTAQVDLFAEPIQPPRMGGTHITTNTNVHKSNRVASRRAAETCAVFNPEPVLSIREAKTGKARLCSMARTRGPAWIIYAAPHRGLAKMPCGAFVWLVCYEGATLHGATDAVADQDMEELEAAATVIQQELWVEPRPS